MLQGLLTTLSKPWWRDRLVIHPAGSTLLDLGVVEDPEETEAVPSLLGEDEPSECDEQTLPARKSAAKMSVVVQSPSKVAHKKLRHTCVQLGAGEPVLVGGFHAV